MQDPHRPALVIARQHVAARGRVGAVAGPCRSRLPRERAQPGPLSGIAPKRLAPASGKAGADRRVFARAGRIQRLANLDKVLGILHRLTGQLWQPHSQDEPVGIQSSQRRLERHTTELLGLPTKGRVVRIMVTLPSEAARDFGMVRQLLISGMDIARINCAHDGPAEWEAMAAHVRRAAKSVDRQVRILMDLGGPKLRTGPIAPGPTVLKLRPRRDYLGRILAPAYVGIRPAGTTAAVPGAPVCFGVAADWLAKLKAGDYLDLTDARGAQRSLLVSHRYADSVLAECARTAYLVPETELRRRRKGRGHRTSGLAELPSRPGYIFLERGSLLRVTREGVGRPASDEHGGKLHRSMPSVACTLPEVFKQVCVGERIFFDDGRIGGVIRQVEQERAGGGDNPGARQGGKARRRQGH